MQRFALCVRKGSIQKHITKDTRRQQNVGKETNLCTVGILGIRNKGKDTIIKK